MTVIVTRNASGRIRGYLASCMCEIAPGVYTAPRMTAAIRDRVWKTLEGWFDGTADVAIVMTWKTVSDVGGQRVRTLGTPRTELAEFHGVYLTRRDRRIGDDGGPAE